MTQSRFVGVSPFLGFDDASKADNSFFSNFYVNSKPVLLVPFTPIMFVKPPIATLPDTLVLGTMGALFKF